MRTQVVVERRDGRTRARLSSGLLRAQLMRSPADRCRVGLLATTALLLGGDEVELEVEVGPGAVLDLFDVAGTVAYHGRGRTASWRVALTVAEGAVLRYAGAPFIVADGADVLRGTTITCAVSGRLDLRDTVVLGRSGEVGGRLRSRTAVDVGGRPVWREDQVLDAAAGRGRPGMLGDLRVLDTIVSLRPTGEDDIPAGTVPGGRGTTGDGADAVRFRLVEGVGTVERYLGRELGTSPLHVGWAGPRGTGQRSGPARPEDQPVHAGTLPS
ncbi:MAG: hypothetical protein JWP61_2179 [Friedmanniella sp.]|nr:hypothetical protein [Friedmanniella sp.]